MEPRTKTWSPEEEKSYVVKDLQKKWWLKMKYMKYIYFKHQV